MQGRARILWIRQGKEYWRWQICAELPSKLSEAAGSSGVSHSTGSTHVLTAELSFSPALARTLKFLNFIEVELSVVRT